MRRIFSISALASSILFLLVLQACVEREEKIEIGEDGAASIHVRFRADSEDELYIGRIPAERDGWSVTGSVESLDDGATKQIRDARRVFPAGAVLPATFGPPGEEDLFLRFPTTIEIEERGDFIYYHFRRTYDGRPWAYLESLKTKVSGNRIEKLEDRFPDQLTPGERAEFIRHMAHVEVLKMLSFARAAFLDITPDGKQDGWLEVHRRALLRLHRLDHARIAELIARKDKTIESEIVREAEAFEADVKLGIVNGLSEACGYGSDAIRRFGERYAWHKRFYEITDDLGCEKFEITLVMPGAIVGTNGKMVEQNRVTWTFEGKQLRDCDQELIASSRVRR